MSLDRARPARKGRGTRQDRATVATGRWRRLRDEEATLAAGEALGRELRPGDLVLLDGPLGAGKTLLARGACVALGIEAREVTSPTYTLVHTYPGRIPVVHADLYRLGPDADLEALGLSDELLEGRHVVLVEWPAATLGAYPGRSWRVEIRPDPSGGRRLRVRCLEE